jgi:hypothetical protein
MMRKIIRFFYDPNMVAIIPVTIIFGYGLYVVIAELIGRII